MPNLVFLKFRYPINFAYSSLFCALIASSEPRGYKYALKSPHWVSAMDEEIDALRSNQMWDLVPLHPGANVVGSKWIF